MPRRIYFSTEETTTTTKKGYIELDEDFTQVYNCFLKVSALISNGTSWKILFWLLADANNYNGIFINNQVYEKFKDYLITSCRTCKITRRTFDRCIDDLVDAHILNRVGKGHYYFNPYMFWQDSKENRIQFITSELKDGNYLSYNPVKDDIPQPNESI